MGIYEVTYTFIVKTANAVAAEELVDAVCHFTYEEPEWSTIISVVAAVHEWVHKEEE